MTMMRFGRSAIDVDSIRMILAAQDEDETPVDGVTVFFNDGTTVDLFGMEARELSCYAAEFPSPLDGDEESTWGEFTNQPGVN